MFGFAKTFAVVAVATLAMQATPAMAFGPGSFARSIGNDIRMEVAVAEVRSPAKAFENSFKKMGALKDNMPEVTVIDFFLTLLDRRGSELAAIGNAFNSTLDAGDGVVTFNNDRVISGSAGSQTGLVSEKLRKPLLIQPIWL